MTANQSRQIIRRFINNNELVEKLVDIMDEDVVSGHVLKDILCSNSTFDKI